MISVPRTMVAARTLSLAATLLMFATAGMKADEAPTLRYTIKEPGQVSLAVYDAEGRQVRTLGYGRVQQPGTYTYSWDGLDRYGMPMPPGTYTWKLLRTPGFITTYLARIGTDEYRWPKKDWGICWVGNHAGPTRAIIDGRGNMIVISCSAEAVPCILCQSLDGRQVRWWQFRRREWKTGSNALQDVTVLGNEVLGVTQTGMIQVYDLETGNPKRTFRVLPEPQGRQIFGPPLFIDGDAGALAVSFPQENKLRWFALDDGRKLRELDVPAPGDIAAAPDGSLYLISNKQVLRRPKDGQPERFLHDAELTGPRCLAVDTHRRELLVAEEHRVHRYDLASGKRVHSYGHTEGRGYGRFDPLRWDGILSVAADGQGGLLVVENFPRRTTRVKTGDKLELLNEWFGGQTWGECMAVDPGDPSLVVFDVGSHGQKGLGRWNEKDASWKLLGILHPPADSGLFPTTRSVANQWELRRRNGKLYLVLQGWRSSGGGPAILQLDPDAFRLLPVARAGLIASVEKSEALARALKHHKVPTGGAEEGRPAAPARRQRKQDQAQTGASEEKPAPAQARRQGRRDRGQPPVPTAFVCTDANGDHNFQPEEFQFGDLDLSAKGQLHLDPDWNLLLPGGTFSDAAGEQRKFAAWQRLVNRAAPGADAPVWRLGEVQTLKDDFNRHESIPGSPIAIYRDHAGCTYAFTRGGRGLGGDQQGERWPAGNFGMARLLKWDAQGRRLWTVGVHGVGGAPLFGNLTAHAAKSAAGIQGEGVDSSEPGRFMEPMRILGGTHDCVVVQDRGGLAVTAWTHDGLYAGFFFDRRPKDELADSIYRFASGYQEGPVLGDQCQGHLIEDQQGRVLWAPLGKNSAPLYEVHGWDGWERQEGTTELATQATSARDAGSGLIAEYFDNDNLAGKPAKTFNEGQIWFDASSKSKLAQLQARRYRLVDFDYTGKAFSARWTGQLEPRFTEPTLLVVEANPGSRVRLWIDGRLVIDGWDNNIEHRGESRLFRLATDRNKTPLLPLRTGNLCDLRLEYASGDLSQPDQHGQEIHPHVHLLWESLSQERRHVPAANLYPGKRTVR